MGNCCGRNITNTEELGSILVIDPQYWNHAQVITWLQLTHDGDLRDLVEAFKEHKIIGSTFVKLTQDNLNNDLNIKQFGLRDGFITQRNILLQQWKHTLNTNTQQNDINININTDNTTKNENTYSTTHTPIITDRIHTPVSHNTLSTYTQMSQMNTGFQNMPNNAFEEHDIQEEDENYIQIDIADLIDLNQSCLYPQSSNQTSQSRFGDIQNRYTIPTISSVTQSNQHMHNHHDADSNYDAFPPEFLHNIPNVSSNPSTHNTISAMSGYQEIEYNDTDNISSAPSNATSKLTIRQLLPPNHAPISIRSPQEQIIHEFARDLWKTLKKIKVKTVPNAHNEANQAIRGFSGKALCEHITEYVARLNEVELMDRCNELVKYGYIRLIAPAHTQETEGGACGFSDSATFLYQFENEKHRQFIKDDEPHRRAWTQGTKVEVFSSTFGEWNAATVLEVNHDAITCTYGPSAKQMRKTLDRYQGDLIRSSDIFINNRNNWKKDTQIEVYSHGQHIWCKGYIEEVLTPNVNEARCVDILRVFYTDNTDNYDKDFAKYVDRWSPDLREVQELSPNLAKYKKGTKVRIWSNSKQMWIPGLVIEVVPMYEVVNVRYGDREKLVSVSSDDIHLVNDD